MVVGFRPPAPPVRLVLHRPFLEQGVVVREGVEDLNWKSRMWLSANTYLSTHVTSWMMPPIFKWPTYKSVTLEEFSPQIHSLQYSQWPGSERNFTLIKDYSPNFQAEQEKINPIIHSLNRHFLSIYYVLGSAWSTEDTEVSKADMVSAYSGPGEWVS